MALRIRIDLDNDGGTSYDTGSTDAARSDAAAGASVQVTSLDGTATFSIATSTESPAPTITGSNPGTSWTFSVGSGVNGAAYLLKLDDGAGTTNEKELIVACDNGLKFPARQSHADPDVRDATAGSASIAAATYNESSNSYGWAKLMETNLRNTVSHTEALSTGLSTGIADGGDLSIGTPTSTVTISAGQGYIVDATTSPTAPTITKVTWSAFTNQSLTYLATSPVTYLSIDSSGALQQSTTVWTQAEVKNRIIIGVAQHLNNSAVDLVCGRQKPSGNNFTLLTDLIEAFGSINVSGNVYSANGANLYVDRSAGSILCPGCNWINSRTSPNRATQSGDTSTSITYVLSDNTVVSVAGTSIDPSKYDDGTSTPATVSTNKFTIQRIYTQPNGNTIVQYGPAEYNTLDAARAALPYETYTQASLLNLNGLLRAYLIVKQGCTDLSDTSLAEFVVASKIGDVAAAGGSGSSTDSDAIHLSTSAEITTLTEKTAPVYSDVAVIEDSEASNAKKFVQLVSISNAIKPTYLSSSRYSPTFHYTLNETLADDTGNKNDLSATAALNYAPILPGLIGGYMNGQRLYLSNADTVASPSLIHTGDMTLQFIGSFRNVSGAIQNVAVVDVGGSSPWGLYVATGAILSAYWSSGGAPTYQTTACMGQSLPALFSMVRSSDTIKFFCNGVQIGSTSGTLTTPTSTGSEVFSIAANAAGTNKWYGCLASVWFKTTALTDAEILLGAKESGWWRS